MTYSFALPNNYDWDIKSFTRQVKTKTWVNNNKKHLYKWVNRLTTANIDNRQVIGGMLQAAFGANIGRQIEEKLNDDDLSKIRLNIINAAYS